MRSKLAEGSQLAGYKIKLFIINGHPAYDLPINTDQAVPNARLVIFVFPINMINFPTTR